MSLLLILLTFVVIYVQSTRVSSPIASTSSFSPWPKRKFTFTSMRYATCINFMFDNSTLGAENCELFKNATTTVVGAWLAQTPCSIHDYLGPYTRYCFNNGTKALVGIDAVQNGPTTISQGTIIQPFMKLPQTIALNGQFLFQKVPQDAYLQFHSLSACQQALPGLAGNCTRLSDCSSQGSVHYKVPSFGDYYPCHIKTQGLFSGLVIDQQN
mmetsp:Transcript_1604/g.2742  ORF Transcript_1604/g.2742 Transcript_1604/m.2742 type:complete len:212 (-) Transcript_1604:3-638(-)